MTALLKYNLIHKIHESANSSIYQGYRKKGQHPVIIKILNKGSHSDAKRWGYIREFKITHSLNIKGVVKASELVDDGALLAIIFEAFNGHTLAELIGQKEILTRQFLPLAIQLTEILGKIHENNIIHLNITPHNILINSSHKDLQIIDFQYAIIVPEQIRENKKSPVSQENLPYISPEQTGRNNRLLNYGSDIYSMGIVFYELLCKSPPFVSSDSLELIHSHLAKAPEPPHLINKNIHEPVSQIILKMISKNPEERYLSAIGITNDLKECLDQLKVLNRIRVFSPGSRDFYGTLHFKEQLYGRKDESRLIDKAFKRTLKGGHETILITGREGLGKTALVHEAFKKLALKKSAFISGKYEQLKQHIPYHALKEAFRGLVPQFLSKSDVELSFWQERILSSLGPLSRIIIDMIPEMEHILGPQPDLKNLRPVENQNRFHLAFKRFLRTLCNPDHTLIIFLDDLQWADSASLDLILFILSGKEIPHLILIGAYLIDEVSASHPLMVAIKKSIEQKNKLTTIKLKPLDLDQSTDLISDVLNLERKKVIPLARLSLEKTNGNPFFLKSFLKSLCKKQLLKFNFSKEEWQWDPERIKVLGYTNNVLELLINEIHQLRKKEQMMLKWAACMGNRFDFKLLTEISKKTEADVKADLSGLMEKGLIILSEDGRQYENTKAWKSGTQMRLEYQFTHKRIQEAVYSLIDESCRQVLHGKIGQILLKYTPPEQETDRIFDMANQLNLGTDVIKDKVGRNKLAEINLMAGKKAKSSAAYLQALDYLKKGIAIQDDNSWQTQYDLTLALHIEAAEMAFLSGDFIDLERLYQTVLQRARCLLDTIRVYELKIEACKTLFKFQEALEIARHVLDLLGVNLPVCPHNVKILLEYIKIRLVLAGKNFEDLTDLPKMQNPNKLAATRILILIGSAAYFAYPKLLPLIVFKLIRLAIKYGNAPETAFSYATYGMILGKFLGKTQSAIQFGELALKVLDQFDNKRMKAKTYYIVNTFLAHGKKHLRETLKPLSIGFKSGLEAGDFEYAGFCAYFYSYHLFLTGKELDYVEQKMAYYHDSIIQIGSKAALYRHDIFFQIVSNLTGSPDNPQEFEGKFYSEQKMLSVHQETNDYATLYYLYFNKLLLNFVFCRYPSALEAASMAEKYLNQVAGLAIGNLFYFYSSLAQLAMFRDVSGKEQKKRLKNISLNQQILKKWSHHAPMNYLHKYYLVEAELARVLEKNDKARDLYDKAIDLAQKHQYLNEEALAHELAGYFNLYLVDIRTARAYLENARCCYIKWGARAKVSDLENRYEYVFGMSSDKENILKDTPLRSNIITGTGLDMASVMKASQAISSEIAPNKLLKKLIEIVIENAGAEKGALILRSEGRLWLAVEGTINNNIRLHQSMPLKENRYLSQSIINYVSRTKESVVLGDAVREAPFANDHYICTYHPKSIMCIPIIQKIELIGVLYLENNLSREAFTSERLEMVKYLSSQIAISLETSRLYKNIEDSEIRYRELYENIIDIVILVDPDGKIKMANPHFDRIMEISENDHTKLNFKKIIHPDDVYWVERYMLDELKNKVDIKDFQFRIINKRDMMFDVECNARCLIKNNHVDGYQMVIRDVTKRKNIHTKLMKSLKDVHNAKVGTIMGLAKLAEYRDKNTGFHLERIREYTRLLALDLARSSTYKDYITKQYIDVIYLSSILHDIGKVGIPDSILLKPGRLTSNEFKIITRHPIIGGDALKVVESDSDSTSFIKMGKEIAYYHHEKWDGTGYPKGLKEDEIPLSARIVAVADVYDALTSDRVYKSAYSHKKASDIIVKDKGTHFDPDIVDAFISNMNSFETICHEMRD